MENSCKIFKPFRPSIRPRRDNELSAGKLYLPHQQTPFSINLLLDQIDFRIRQVLKSTLACKVLVHIIAA